MESFVYGWFRIIEITEIKVYELNLVWNRGRENRVYRFVLVGF